MLLYKLEAMTLLQMVSEAALIAISYINNLTGGNDYDSISQNVAIRSGTTNSSFSVAIMNDNILEDTENFTLTIISTSQRDVTIDGSGQATVNIMDDDGKQIQTTIIHVFN